MKLYQKKVEYCFQCPNLKRLVIGNPESASYLPAYLRDMSGNNTINYCSAHHDRLVPVYPNNKPNADCPLKDIE